YPLWDAGLEVGHATRTVKESVRLAAEDLQTHTSFMDARVVAGDASLCADLVEAVDAFTRKRRGTFAKDLAAATAARHGAAGDVPFLLEPNVKDGAGGLRDRQVASWLARFFGDGFPVAAGDPAEMLHRIRNWLHDHTGRRTDVLSLPLQDEAAAALGYPGERTGDELMRDYYAAARAVWWDATSRLDAAIGREGVAFDPSPFGSRAWTPEARREFLAALRSGSARTLEAMDQSGALQAMLPGWDAIRSLPQRNVYHRYTVDVHCFESVAQMAALRSVPEERLAADVWGDLADPDRALVAALFHDAGKGATEDHSVVGERRAREWTLAMGLSPEAIEDVAWLVRHHLLLAETATRRDTGDERLVESLAAQIGDAERAKMLYVLTVADAKATGPEAWTPWKSALVAELFSKVMHVLALGEVVGADVDALIRSRTTEVRDALSGRELGEIDAHLLGMTRAYVLAFPAGDLVRHFAMMHPSPGTGEARLDAMPAADPGVWDATLVARDRPGLFATMSGALAVNGINILAAQGFTRADGIALEVFRVVGALDPELPPARWDRVRDTARAVLAGDMDLDREIEERRRAYARPSKGKREPTHVVVDNGISDFATVVEVHATDRVGLLYDITHTLAELGLDIHLARIATYGDDVVDVFYVRDLLGQRINDQSRMDAVRAALLRRLG
ncbi:MAG: HD domain-containing protein, partial [Actinomycetota bacterium]